MKYIYSTLCRHWGCGESKEYIFGVCVNFFKAFLLLNVRVQVLFEAVGAISFPGYFVVGSSHNSPVWLVHFLSFKAAIIGAFILKSHAHSRRVLR